MRLLLDTHVLLWWLTGSPRLATKAAEAIQNGRNLVFVSSVSAWEIAIKQGLGKLRVPDNLSEQIHRSRFDVLNITIDHALGVAHLPAHHGDPFDRMLVAQALRENLTIVTTDDRIGLYQAPVLRAT